MKKITILLFLFLCIANIEVKAQETTTTTYYFIRHAEKSRKNKNNPNPNLIRKGKKRAKKWESVFKNVNFDQVYSTNYNRTIQTATPTAKSKNLNIQFYNPKALYSNEFKENTKGKTVLVVGHSNTTPMFVNKILGKEKYKDIDDKNNANLYVVTIENDCISAICLKIE
jgi:broad specificity phosphatase PhoE